VPHRTLGPPEGPVTVPASRHTWKWLAGCALVVLALAGIIYSQWPKQGFDWRLAVASLTRLRWQWLLASLVPIYATYWGRALRWAVFLKPIKPRPSTAKLLSATIIGFTAITLFGRAGDFVRPYLIAVKEQVPVSSQLAAWLLERVFDLLMASLLLGFALSRVHGEGLQVGPKFTWVLAFGGRIVWICCTLVFVVLLSLRHLAEPARRRLIAAFHFLPEARFQKVERLLTALVQGVESTRSDAALMLIFLYSVLEWILIAACYWCVVQAFTGIINFTFVDVLILMGFVSFGGVVQIPGIGGGTQVAAALVLTELFGIRLELASSFAVFIWIVTFVAVVPAGLALALKEGLDWHSLRQMGQEASK
jgi:glycosyltransferase 2 family protein